MILLIFILFPLMVSGQIDSTRYEHSEVYNRTVLSFQQETIWMQSNCTFEPSTKYRCQIKSTSDKVTIVIIEINQFLSLALGYDPHFEYGSPDSVEAVVLQLHENIITELDYGYNLKKDQNLVLPGGTIINLKGDYYLASFKIGGDPSGNKFIMPRYEFDY